MQRRIQRYGTQVRADNEVAIGLKAGRKRPLHRLVGKDVDVRIDDEHVLHFSVGPERRGDRVAGLAGNALAQRDAQVCHAAASRRRIDGERLPHGTLQRAPGRGFGTDRVELRGIGRTHVAPADRQRLEERVAAHRDRSYVKNRIVFCRSVVAEELAVGALEFRPAAFVEIAFEHHLGVSRNLGVDRHTRHERHRASAERAGECEFVRRRPRADGRNAVGRMRPHDERDRHALPALDVIGVDAMQVAGSYEIDAGFVRPAQHQAPVADVAPRAVETAADIDAR